MAKAVPEELSEGALRAKLGRRHRATHPTLPPQHHSPLPHSPLPHPPPHTRLVDRNRPKDAAASMDLLRAGWRVGGGVRWRPPVSRARARALSLTRRHRHTCHLHAHLVPRRLSSLTPPPALTERWHLGELCQPAPLSAGAHTRARALTPTLLSPHRLSVDGLVPLSCFKCDAPTPPTPTHPTHPRAGALKPAETEAIAGWLKDRHDKALYAGSAIKRSNNKVRLYTHSTSIRGECKV